MKTLTTLCFCCMITLGVQAANLTATVVKAVSGKKNGKITLSVSGGNAPFTFSWTGPSGYVAGWQNPDSLGAGTYCVTVTDRYCGKASLCVSVGESPNALTETQLSATIIYPNPFKDDIRIQPGEALIGNIQMSLWDLAGRKLAAETAPAQTEIRWSLPRQLPAGAYLFILEDEQGKQERRLLIRQEE